MGRYRYDATVTNLFQVQIADRGGADDNGGALAFLTGTRPGPWMDLGPALILDSRVGTGGASGLWQREFRGGTTAGLPVATGLVRDGTPGGDVLEGGTGADILNGGFGSDRLNGGTGAAVTPGDFRVNCSETLGAGVSGVAEAFVIHRPTGQILRALIDGADQTAIWLRIGTVAYDIG